MEVITKILNSLARIDAAVLAIVAVAIGFVVIGMALRK